MTKDEFYNDIQDFDDLIGFCRRYGCYHIVENIYDPDQFDDWVWDCIDSLRSRWFWHDLRDVLENLDEPDGYFIPTGDLEYNELGTMDLEHYMDEVIDWGDCEDFWEDDCDPDNEDYNDDDEDKDWVDDQFEVVINLAEFIGVDKGCV